MRAGSCSRPGCSDLEFECLCSQVGFFLGLLREGLVQAGHSMLPRTLHRNAATPQGELANHIYNRICYSYIFQSTGKLAWSIFAGMNHSERYLPSPGLATNYGFHGSLMSMLGWEDVGPPTVTEPQPWHGSSTMF